MTSRLVNLNFAALISARAALAAALLTACAGRIAAQSAAEWRLAPEAQVDSTGIFFDQLIVQQVQTVQPVAPPRLRLALAPPLGQTVLLSRQQVAACLETNCPLLASTNWTGARQVRVTRRLRQLAEPELLEMLTGFFQTNDVKTRGELELHTSNPWKETPVPDEPLTLKITEMPPNGISPSFLAGIELWCGKERVGSWQVGLRARVWKDIAVAHALLKRGELFSASVSEIAMQRSDILLVREPLFDLASVDPSMELIENVPVGMPVTLRALRMRPLVHRGRIVEGVFRQGSLEISLKVEALEDGLLGQTVRVRNPKTRRELFGKVENESTVNIAL